ncbi:MAG TPA: 50S ribosomal protein L32 [Erysipelothrix sp.]|jgi:large subunit ribosomal protein L32|nr:50S ribosomal protein L32 [Erysipelothrix sp.]
MAVPKRRTSKARKNKRRTHYKLAKITLVKDEKTGEYHRPHRPISDAGEFRAK